MELSEVKHLFESVVEQIGKVVIGQLELVEGTVIAALCRRQRVD